MIEYFDLAFEGIDGSGKTTQAELLIKRLVEELMPVRFWHYTAKDNFWGNMIKACYSEDVPAPIRCVRQSRYFQETLYALSSRASYKKAKSGEGNVLIADRSIVTAYASHLDLLPFWFLDLVEISAVPRTVLFLDVEPEQAFERIENRKGRLCDENLGELINFKGAYERIMGSERPSTLRNTRFIRVDGQRDERIIADEIYGLVKHEVLK
ncbi:AAA family ATPase [Candidatus Woesearchaeota archaeon]|jgi:dTMP kinase|nr:AAA family ATPase [Candidatus Woesearchaeota archaeon]MBT4368458.1 AAA family ATPase [Candidatus Woesearchaeota archaeon]MBT4712947.1 AAA family ATPase [Candidatus Woesearchaeota archaeon]MBT6639859.1 AAA family ATPase [Candidatus Woesearchaeota archaeon]MBT7134031.1 AAA family ATPase [Candidatus Woesearchaeota archaeon]